MQYRLKAQYGDTIAVPQLLFSRLGNAEEASVRTALYVLATGVTDPERIAADLRLRSPATAQSALVWWAGAGLLEEVPEAAPAAAPAPAALSWQELAAAARTDPMIASLIDCAQTRFGRTLSHTEMQRLVALYLQDNFDPEVIMLCISYLHSRQKCTLGALSHELKAWQAEGVCTGEDADAHLRLLELRSQREQTVCRLLKLPAEALTLGAKKAIARWYEAYQYDDDMVAEAALQAGDKQDVWYLNGILTKWHGQGLRSIHDVRGGGAAASPAGRNVRVDRSTPSDSDFLKNAAQRPRRLKRKD